MICAPKESLYANFLRSSDKRTENKNGRSRVKVQPKANIRIQLPFFVVIVSYICREFEFSSSYF